MNKVLIPNFFFFYVSPFGEIKTIMDKDRGLVEEFRRRKIKGHTCSEIFEVDPTDKFKISGSGPRVVSIHEDY